MRLEKTTANVSEHEFGDGIADILNSLGLVLRSSASFNGNGKQLLEVTQRELIHRVDEGQV
jgi:hypothetical protein